MMAYINGPTVEQREYAKKQYKSHTVMFFVVLYVVIYYHSGAGLIRQLRSVEIPVGTASTKFGCRHQKLLHFESLSRPQHLQIEKGKH